MRVALAPVILLVMLSALWSCTRNDHSEKVETVTIGRNSNEADSLLHLTETKGLFAANGIKVVFKDYVSGVASSDGLLKGEVDLATCAEFVTVGKILRKESILVVACVNKFKNVCIVGRSDKGIRSIDDLKGKKIGLPRWTSPEFYLGRFLELHGMSILEVNLVDFTPAKTVDAIVNGGVDAVVVFQPHPFEMKKRLGDRLVMWPAESGQLDYFTLIGKDAWVKSHPNLISRLLKALVQAEDYLVGHPEETKSIVKKWLQYEDAYIDEVWGNHRFSVSLDQGLILAMEDEARWLIKNGLTPEKNVPDFLPKIYLEGLKGVKPAALTVIH
jgi:NitT/TauT family transport system substrate-binding protein